MRHARQRERERERESFVAWVSQQMIRGTKWNQPAPSVFPCFRHLSRTHRSFWWVACACVAPQDPWMWPNWCTTRSRLFELLGIEGEASPKEPVDSFSWVTLLGAFSCAQVSLLFASESRQALWDSGIPSVFIIFWMNGRHTRQEMVLCLGQAWHIKNQGRFWAFVEDTEKYGNVR